MQKLETMKFARTSQPIRRVGSAVLVVLTLLALAGASSSIVPLYGNSAGNIESASITELKTGWVVTAVCNSKAKLEMIVWNDTGTALARKGTYTATRDCVGVAVTTLNDSTVVTVNGAQASFAFEVTAWQVSSTGSISPLGTTAASCATCGAGSVSIATLDATRVVTASITSDYALLVSAWLVPSNGDITLQGSAQATGTFSNTPGITAPNSSQVITAGPAGNCGQVACDLEVISWNVDGSGDVVEQNTAQAGVSGYVGAISWNSNTVVTPLINSSHDLELISWSVSSGGVITRQAAGTAGQVQLSPIAACIIPTDNLPFTAVYDSSSYLAAEVWEPSGSSGLKELTTDDTKLLQFAIGAVPIGPHRVVTAAATEPNIKLELEEWELESSSADN